MHCAGHLQSSIGDSFPKGLTSPALGFSSSTREEDSSKLVATSSQVSTWVAMPDNSEPIILPSEAVCTPTNLPTETLLADLGALPTEVILLEEEMSNAMGCLLITRASLDAHQRKQVSDFQMAIHQNDAEATEAIRETKVHCGSVIREVEVCCAADSTSKGRP